MAAPDLQLVKPQDKDHVYSDAKLDRHLEPNFVQPSPSSFEGINALTVPLMTETECKGLLNQLTDYNFSFWSKNEADRDYRNANTVEVIDQGFADGIWHRIKAHVVESIQVTPDDSFYEQGSLSKATDLYHQHQTRASFITM
eukprot:m.53215 g.53215  ORF g.53215 m.53215 type:complete len:142 (+) comp13540_c1_seq6:53-478(+)